MRLLKMTGLLIVLSMLAVGCSSDDDDVEDLKSKNLI